MIGYSKDSRSYRVYNPHNTRITEIRNVPFIDTPRRALSQAGQNNLLSSNGEDDETNEDYRQYVLSHLSRLDAGTGTVETVTRTKRSLALFTTRGHRAHPHRPAQGAWTAFPHRQNQGARQTTADRRPKTTYRGHTRISDQESMMTVHKIRRPTQEHRPTTPKKKTRRNRILYLQFSATTCCFAQQYAPVQGSSAQHPERQHHRLCRTRGQD